MSRIKAGKNPNMQMLLTNGNARKTKEELYADFLRAKLRLEAKLLNRTAIEKALTLTGDKDPPASKRTSEEALFVLTNRHKIRSTLFMHTCSYVQLNFVFFNYSRFIHSSIHHTLAHILY